MCTSVISSLKIPEITLGQYRGYFGASTQERREEGTAKRMNYLAAEQSAQLDM